MSDLARGGAAVSAVSALERWEISLLMNLRCWRLSIDDQARATCDKDREWAGLSDREEMPLLDALIRVLVQNAHRPLVRHEMGCACVGSDECLLLHLVRTASDGHLNDAALIATLMIGPAHAELAALLAGQLGSCARQKPHADRTKVNPQRSSQMERLH